MPSLASQLLGIIVGPYGICDDIDRHIRISASDYKMPSGGIVDVFLPTECPQPPYLFTDMGGTLLELNFSGVDITPETRRWVASIAKRNGCLLSGGALVITTIDKPGVDAFRDAVAKLASCCKRIAEAVLAAHNEGREDQP